MAGERPHRIAQDASRDAASTLNPFGQSARQNRRAAFAVLTEDVGGPMSFTFTEDVLHLADAEWSKFSDRKIAEMCGVGADLVGDVRRQLSESDNSNGSPKRTGRDGKSYPAAKITPARKPQQIAVVDDDDEPDAEGYFLDPENGSADGRRGAAARGVEVDRRNVVYA
jgi:hypothetical protein